jgi:hypothetical protein
MAKSKKDAAKEAASAAAAAMARKRWDDATRAERVQVGKDLAAARWAGHVAKRPASSRKKKKG